MYYYTCIKKSYKTQEDVNNIAWPEFSFEFRNKAIFFYVITKKNYLVNY